MLMNRISRTIRCAAPWRAIAGRIRDGSAVWNHPRWRPWLERTAVPAALLGFAALFAAGCGAARREVRAPTEPTHVAVGSASWYGKAFAGRPTASGEIFDPKKLTAAHRTLPLGSVVRVVNLKNGRSVLVRVNDRGPFTPGRILDCSEAAARALGFRRHGIAHVAIDWPHAPGERTGEDGDYWLQLGAFETVAAARRHRARVTPVANSIADSIALHRHADLLRLHAGPYHRRKHAEKALSRLQEAGFDGAVVVLNGAAVPTVD